MDDNDTPVLDTYCADPDCGPESPCATCLTLPVPRQTMRELVYEETVEADPTDVRHCSWDDFARRTP